MSSLPKNLLSNLDLKSSIKTDNNNKIDKLITLPQKIVAIEAFLRTANCQAMHLSLLLRTKISFLTELAGQIFITGQVYCFRRCLFSQHAISLFDSFLSAVRLKKLPKKDSFVLVNYKPTLTW